MAQRSARPDRENQDPRNVPRARRIGVDPVRELPDGPTAVRRRNEAGRMAAPTTRDEHPDVFPRPDGGVYGWRMETTFQEARTHLGVETQRQWSDLAILRTTPALLGLFSLVTVWANWMVRSPTVRSAREPPDGQKRDPTFSDAIAAVRHALWYPPDLRMSRQTKEIIEIPATLLQRLTETLCHAA